MERDDTVAGVLGGMGPAATHTFFGRLIENADAEKDQDHFRIVIDSNPKIPDRTDHLVNDGPSPLPELIETAKNIEELGADILAIPCNTSHAYFKEISRSVDMEVLNMIELAVDAIENDHGDGSRIGLLATDGTVRSQIYQDHVHGSDLELVLPEDRLQHSIMKAVYGDEGIKAGYYDEPRESLVEVSRSFGDVDVIVAGCSEISVVLSDEDVRSDLLDPLTPLSSAVVERVGCS